MQDKLDIRTSASLLEKLRIFQEQQALGAVYDAGTPLLDAWGRRASCPTRSGEADLQAAAKLVQDIPRSCTTRQRISGVAENPRIMNWPTSPAQPCTRYPARRTGSSEIYELLLHTRTAWTTSSGLHEVRSACSGCSMTPWKRSRWLSGRSSDLWELFRRRFLGRADRDSCQRIQPQRSGRRDARCEHPAERQSQGDSIASPAHRARVDANT